MGVRPTVREGTNRRVYTEHSGHLWTFLDFLLVGISSFQLQWGSSNPPEGIRLLVRGTPSMTQGT